MKRNSPFRLVLSVEADKPMPGPVAWFGHFSLVVRGYLWGGAYLPIAY